MVCVVFSILCAEDWSSQDRERAEAAAATVLPVWLAAVLAAAAAAALAPHLDSLDWREMGKESRGACRCVV